MTGIGLPLASSQYDDYPPSAPGMYGDKKHSIKEQMDKAAARNKEKAESAKPASAPEGTKGTDKGFYGHMTVEEAAPKNRVTIIGRGD